MARTQIHLISYNFMGKHAFWMASFQCLAKSLLATMSLVHEFHLQFPCSSLSTELFRFPPISAKGKQA